MTKSVDTKEQLELVKVATPEDLAEFLRSRGIDIGKWTGQQGTKTLDHFFREIHEGEAQLAEIIRDEAKSALRLIMVGGAHIYHCPANGTALFLREKYVENLSTGDKKDRKRSYAVGEKAKPGESHRDAMIRGIREELQIRTTFGIAEISRDVRTEISASFPDLNTRYDERRFNVVLNAEQFNQDGYIETRDGKRIVFAWEPVPTNGDKA